MFHNIHKNYDRWLPVKAPYPNLPEIATNIRVSFGASHLTTSIHGSVSSAVDYKEISINHFGNNVNVF
jgi:hypothetical protein